LSREEDFSEYVAARWPRLVRSAVLLGMVARAARRRRLLTTALIVGGSATAAAGLVITVSILSSPRPPTTPAEPPHPGLTDQEYAAAVNAAEEEIRAADATVTSATVTVGNGTVTDSNLGYRCESGRLLHLKLIGTFPHIDTTGHPVEPAPNNSDDNPPEDFTVHAMLLTVDAESGRPCLMGVQTGDVAPEPGSIALPLK
jgi:hypothetical protein